MNPMIPDPESYFGRLLPRRSTLIERLEKEAAAEDIPIVGPVVGELLYLLGRISRARRILELGTASGYSTLFLAEACREVQGHVISLEQDPDLARKAENHLAQAGLKDTAEIVCADALAWLVQTTERFDFVFMDIEKEDYVTALPRLHKILAPGGLLVADNVGFQDADTFNRALAADTAWRAVSLYAFLPGHSPHFDGLCLAVRSA